MGRKRAWKRQHLLFYAIGCLIMSAGITACTHLAGPWQTENPLSQARAFMEKGSYTDALRQTQAVLRSGGENQGDQALHLMGIIYAHPENPDKSPARSLESFQILIKKYPHSILTPDAVAWVSTLRKIKKMENEIQTLKDQIDKLKKIDLGIEEKKRRNLPH